MENTWHTEGPRDGILVVTINQADRPVNVLSQSALEELSPLIDRIKNEAEIEGVLFISGKPGCFIAGADVTEFKDLQGADAARQISQFGQKIFQKLENLKKPTVALISGSCLGGGLEFAMACRYRIADDHSKTQLALPEVQLGLIPGWGGTVRLPRLAGMIDALPLILTGKRLNGFQARSKGIVHDVVPTEALSSVGEKILSALISTKSRTSAEAKLFRRRKPPLSKRIQNSIKSLGLVKKYALRKATQQTLAQTHGHYPAPLAAIDVLRNGLGASEKQAFAFESETVAKLGEDPVTQECMRLFFMQEDAKKPPASLTAEVKSDSIKQTAVLGAGAMGAGIALLLAKKGVWTRLKDIKPEFVGKGMATIRKQVKSSVRRRRMTKVEAQNALDHVSPTIDYRGLKNADIVIEAVLEDLDIKRQVFQELADATGPETVLATNTSSLLVSEIAKDVPHPERVVGLHFFNPPHKMPLVEVIKTDKTSSQALATAIALVQRIGKTKVVVRDCAGFLVNRLLSPYMNEAGFLLTEVDDPMEIEKAAIDFGMPMGPLELTDLVGIDVAAHVAENMRAAYGDRMESAPIWKQLKELRQKNLLSSTSLLTGKGKDKRLNESVADAIGGKRQPMSREQIIERLIYPIINEAARCIEENIVEKPEDIDLAMVFGTGFAPFRGGPLRYADSIGLDRIVQRLEQFAAEHSRLAPSEALRRIAATGNGFSSQLQEQRSSAVA